MSVVVTATVTVTAPSLMTAVRMFQCYHVVSSLFDQEAYYLMQNYLIQALLCTDNPQLSRSKVQSDLEQEIMVKMISFSLYEVIL